MASTTSIDGTIVNAGTVIGAGTNGVGIMMYSGITGSGPSPEIRNSGLISGTSMGVNLQAPDGRLVNEEGGEIVGGQYGVFVGGGTGLAATVINHGTIRTAGSNLVLYLSIDADKVVNDGAIYGNVYLSYGNDTFDNRGGSVDGQIQGGDGNDTLIIDKAKYKLTEIAGQGDLDTVKSSVSYVLSDNVEKPVLIGSKDISGTGTARGDLLYGNVGNNALKGLAGSDNLSGGKGNDRLTGGGDADTFHFATGYGKDTITDFEQGIDTIDLSAWKEITNFRQVKGHAEDHAADLWISDGGDTLIVKHLHKADLAGGDFDFL